MQKLSCNVNQRRITFDQSGHCNACQWKNKKDNLDWNVREIKLRSLLDKHRSSDGSFDCLVPVSGGKDGSYVAHNLKNKYGMNPLCITVTPPLQLEIGKKNIQSFINSGYTLISVDTNPETMQYFNKKGFIEIVPLLWMAYSYPNYTSHYRFEFWH